MKLTTEKIVKAYAIMQGAKLGKLEDKEKIAVVRMANRFRKIYNDYAEFERDALERLKPEGFEEIQRKLQTRESLTPAESLAFSKLDRTMGECVGEEKNKEHEFEFEPLKEETLERLVSSNDFAVSDIMALYDAMGE